MDCVITAGGRPGPDDPLYPYSQGQPKALLDMGGRTMLERVVAGLQASRYVEDIVIVGLDEVEIKKLQFGRPAHSLPDQGSLVQNALAGVHWANQNRPGATELLLSSADVPLITGPLIDSLIDSCRPFDCVFYYLMARQETMEKRFPGSKRTFVPLTDGRVAGGDIFLIQPWIADTHRETWEAMTNARKHAWKLARLVGLGTLLKYLFRRLSIADLEAIGLRFLGHPIKVVMTPHAELVMDADKPYQVDLLRREFAEPTNMNNLGKVGTGFQKPSQG
jgi:molybdopterin-guanine dinucleotide biosynthesis protein A